MSIQQVPMLITFYGIASFAAAIVAYVVASAKHRDGSHWATISFLFPPAVLIPLLMTTAPPEHRAARASEVQRRKYAEADHD
jgi:hypothetical protein